MPGPEINAELDAGPAQLRVVAVAARCRARVWFGENLPPLIVTFINFKFCDFLMVTRKEAVMNVIFLRPSRNVREQNSQLIPYFKYKRSNKSKLACTVL